MDAIQIANRLQEQFATAILASLPREKHPRVHIAAASVRPVAEFLFHEPDLAFDWLSCLTAVDYVADNELAVVYDLRSMKHGHEFAVKAFLGREQPVMASVTDLWPGANWHEREAYDLMGIVFEGHPDLRRILLPEDWAGHPLRKDYVFPREYHGIPGSYEMDWQQKPDYPV
ncbi:MAG: NADH-quinone oxidoreductase subunit C [Phycisphaeraceae bacterium]|nr:NADH-quinone oxidoreductase subunit C [Phycisphaeraceae bacterium]